MIWFPLFLYIAYGCFILFDITTFLFLKAGAFLRLLVTFFGLFNQSNSFLFGKWTPFFFTFSSSWQFAFFFR